MEKDKICSKCKESKPLSKFSKDKQKSDGYRPSCKECSKKRYEDNKGKVLEQMKKWYLKNKEEIIKRKNEYREEHKEEIRKTQKKYYIGNKDKFLGKIKKYQEKNKEKITKRQKKYYENNREKLLVKAKKYRENNKEKINNNSKKRYHTDINFKLATNLRHGLNRVLNGISKSNSAIKLLGCSIEFLKKYLEKQFTKGMSWDNYGKWHIDHIKPCSKFDLTKKFNQRKCFNYKNLQPLWAEENFKKGNKYAGK